MEDFFECVCGRKQTRYWEELAEDATVECGGITEKTAMLTGWVKAVDGIWKCPFCSGKSSNLKRLFGSSTSFSRETLMEVNVNLGVVEAISDALAVEIENSKYILMLKDNWDDEGAPSYSEEVLNRAISFLKIHAQAFYKIFAAPILAPRISHGPDGSIDLCWSVKASKVVLAVNIPKSISELADFYGDRDVTDRVAGSLNPSEVNLWLFFWLMYDSACVSEKKDTAEYCQLLYDLWVNQEDSKIKWESLITETISDFWPIYPSVVVERAICGDIEFRIHKVEDDLFYSIWTNCKVDGSSRWNFADGYFRKSIEMTKIETEKFYKKLMREFITGEKEGFSIE